MTVSTQDTKKQEEIEKGKKVKRQKERRKKESK